MIPNKEHREFFSVALSGDDWRPPPSYPRGIEQKILAGALDEVNKTGGRTRLLRFQPGAFTTTPFVHDYWEEVYLLSGDLTVSHPRGLEPIQRFTPNTYACRPPGVEHGPFRSEGGCLLLEFHYYE
jgi:hypothetical protein